jgi:hypothetical protein
MPTQRGLKQGEELTPNTMGQVTVCLETLIKLRQDVTNFNITRNRDNLLGFKSEETRRRRIQRATELR